MQIIYSNNDSSLCPANNSVFLAGPTPRLKETLSWRPEAVELFKKYNFSGTLCYPEYEPGLDLSQCDYNNQIEWEHHCLETCSLIMFWVPRDIKGNMPAFTTNIEFGYWIAKAPHKVVYGRPEQADNMKYMDYMYNKITHYPIPNKLDKLIKKTIVFLELEKLWDESTPSFARRFKIEEKAS